MLQAWPTVQSEPSGGLIDGIQRVHSNGASMSFFATSAV